MSVALIVLMTGTMAAAAIDLHHRRIPNPLTAAMALAAVAVHLAEGPLAVVIVVAVMAVSFALGMLAFSAGWFGGGDVKLIAAACGLVTYPGCIWLVLYTLITGAVLALVQAAVQRRLFAVIRSASALALSGSVPQSPALLPYGVAIAGGSIAYVFATLISAIRLPS
jgi:prepilin peptidase CpaA